MSVLLARPDDKAVAFEEVCHFQLPDLLGPPSQKRVGVTFDRCMCSSPACVQGDQVIQPTHWLRAVQEVDGHERVFLLHLACSAPSGTVPIPDIGKVRKNLDRIPGVYSTEKAVRRKKPK